MTIPSASLVSRPSIKIEVGDPMSIRAFVDEECVLRKPKSNVAIKMRSVWASYEAIVSLSFRDSGSPNEVRIGAHDLVRMLEVLVADPRYEDVVQPKFVEASRRNYVSVKL